MPEMVQRLVTSTATVHCVSLYFWCTDSLGREGYMGLEPTINVANNQYRDTLPDNVLNLCKFFSRCRCRSEQPHSLHQ